MILLLSGLRFARAASEEPLCLDLAHLQTLLARADSTRLVSARQRLLADTLRSTAMEQLNRLDAGPYGWMLAWDATESRESRSSQDQIRTQDSLRQVAVSQGWATATESARAQVQQHCGKELEPALLGLLESWRNNPWDLDVLDQLVLGYARLSRVYRSADVLDQCLALFQHAIRRNAQSYTARFQLARVLHAQGRPREALPWLYQAEDEFLHSVSLFTNDRGVRRPPGFQGIPKSAAGAPGDVYRDNYRAILWEQFACEQEAGLVDNALATLERLAPYTDLTQEEVSGWRQSLQWGGTPQSRLDWQAAREAESRLDYVLAAELYTRSLEGVRSGSEAQRVTYDLAWVTAYRLEQPVAGIRLFRRMVDLAPLLDNAGQPLDTVAVERLTRFGDALFDYASILDGSGQSEDALELYDELCRVPNPRTGLALLASAVMTQANHPDEALARLERLEAMIGQNGWGLPVQPEERRTLRRQTYISLMRIHRLAGRLDQAEHYHALATRESDS
ncbi:MAG: hypothetical protein H6678_06240 [Candidatus Delongbacteria bacterium]|nr:hypothetical protein [Candidatus Delongbacteria bacterium]